MFEKKVDYALEVSSPGLAKLPPDQLVLRNVPQDPASSRLVSTLEHIVELIKTLDIVQINPFGSTDEICDFGQE